RPLRLPGPGRGRLPVRPAGLRVQPDAGPHLGAQADRGEVEPASADPPGRRRLVTAGHGRSGGRARLRRAAQAARADAAVGLVEPATTAPGPRAATPPGRGG